MSNAIARSRIGAMTYLAPGSGLTSDEQLAMLQEAVTSCVAAHHVHLVLDLKQVSLLNSKALELMLDAQAKLTTLGGRLKLVNPNPLLKDIFLATGFDQYVPVVDALTGVPEKSKQFVIVQEKKKLGDILLKKDLVKHEQLAEAVLLQKKTGKRIGKIVVDKGWVPEVELLKALSEQLEIPYISLRSGLHDPAALELLGKAAAQRLEVMPMFCIHGRLTLASNDPQSVPALDEIESITGCKARLVLAKREDILKNLFDGFSGNLGETDFVDAIGQDLEVIESQIPEDYTLIDEMAGESPVINLVNGVIQRAIRDRASDVHFEISRSRSRIRFRIDGVMYEVMTPRLELHPAIVSRLKVMANLDIAERRLPQDGRIQVATQGRTVDLRFSSLPGIMGEKVVLRVLDRNQSILDVEKLGMSPANLGRFKGLLKRSHGLILATGPTGSGKTTTLYAAVNYLKSMEKNLVTIEDPVEYQLEIINQNQVNDAVGLTFPKILRHVLRQDPDIIMVGEIRDRQTAEIAVQAALTGHLVLSTLHTNDAVGAVSRLVEMGVEPYLLSSALIGVVAQRLVRQVCGACKTTYIAEPAIVAVHGWDTSRNIHLTRGRGCAACYDSGYKGRLGIHELLEVNDGLQRLLVVNANREMLLAHTVATGHKDLRADGIERALNGMTTLEEISRVIHIQ